MNKIVFLAFLALASRCVCLSCYAQGKLTTDQLVNILHDSQNHPDTVNNADLREPVLCDTATTIITLEVINDKLMGNLPYTIICTGSGIEVTVFDGDDILYKSAFEYVNNSFSKIKSRVNAHKIFKVDTYKDTALSEVSYILSLFKGQRKYISVENYYHRTNAVGGLNSLATEIRDLIPTKMIASTCHFDSERADSVPIAVQIPVLVASENQISFPNNGCDFKKIKIKCETNDWEIQEAPDWVNITKSDDAIVVESTENNSQEERTGVIKIGSFSDVVSITVIQQ